MSNEPKPRAKPSIIPNVPVASWMGGNTTSVQITPDAVLPALTREALARALGTRDPDLEWRWDYSHDNQLGDAGSNWKGRRPADGDEAAFQDMLVCDDQITPAMQREVDAQFARNPEWDAVQNGAKLEDKAPTVAAMSRWHDAARLNAAARDAARTYWWSGQMLGRVYVPDEYADLLTSATTLEAALELIHVQALDPREAGPILNRHGRVLGYWYRYARDEDTVVEVHVRGAVLTYVGQPGHPLELELHADSPFSGSGMLMFHAERDGGSAISKSVKADQDRLTVVKTYAGRNDDQTGYRQIIVSNAEPFKDRRGNLIPMPMGPGVAVQLKGLLKGSDPQDPKAGRDRHTPTWQVIEPLNPEDYHIPSIRMWKTSILEKLDQLWTLNPESAVSGESKRQSRKPFDRRASFAGQDMGAFVAWALQAALTLACQITGGAEAEGVTFQTKVYLDVDALNLEELKVKLDMWRSGALTLVSLLESTPGVSDALAEAARLKAEGGGDVAARQAALDRLTADEPAPGDETE